MSVRIAFRLCLALSAAALLCSCEDSDISGSVSTTEPQKTEVIEVHTVTEADTVQQTETTEAASETGTLTQTATLTETSVKKTEAPTEPITEPPVPSDDGQLVLIKDYIPDIYLDIRYATTNNFTGTVIYENADAYLCYGTVKKLMAVQDVLRLKGLSLIIWDAYRPVEAQQRLWEVCPNPTYVADPRNGITSHSRGNTVDLGIVAADGSYVPVPTEFDEFSSLADRDYTGIPEDAAKNSQMLEDIMSANGFYGYWGEWWHYSDSTEYQWHF